MKPELKMMTIGHRNDLPRVLVTILLLTGAPAMATEEPQYEVVASNDTYEVRRYEPYIVAEVDIVAESERKAGNRAFRILAGYIFGDNKAQQRMAMTAPVETTAADTGARMTMAESVETTANDAGEKAAITDPVETTAEANAFVYAFIMERKYTLDTLPEPLDPRIRIRAKPARYVAALRFSGVASARRYEKYREKLRVALDRDRMRRRGEFVLARYDAPFTPPFMRRNEVLINLDWRPTADRPR